MGTTSSCLFLSWSSSLCVWNVHPVKQTSHHLNRVAPRRMQLNWTSTFTWGHFYVSVINDIKGVKLPVQTFYSKTSVRRMLRKYTICSVEQISTIC